MLKFCLLPLTAAACMAVTLAPSRDAVAQPSALKPMQDAQRKAEQKAREAKKEEPPAQAHDDAQKPENAKPASSP